MLDLFWTIRDGTILATDYPSSPSLRNPGAQRFHFFHLATVLTHRAYSCTFAIDPLDDCIFIFQQPLNDCNTASNEKQASVSTHVICALSLTEAPFREELGLTRVECGGFDPGTYFTNENDF